MTRLRDYFAAAEAVPTALTAAFAFLVGGLVVLAAGHDPLSTYEAIFRGAGLDYLLPWVSGAQRATAAFSLQQTLILATPLLLLGIAVAIGFRTGLFNIGGQGQYLVGSFAGVWIASSWPGLPGAAHVALALGLGALAGAAWAGIAGLLKATAGAHEVITTIMLNYAAIWAGSYLFGIGGPLQSDRQPTVPVSSDVVPDARLPVLWGNPDLQGMHAGLFIALAGLLAFWVLLHRSVLGFELRTVGANPEAARYAGISLRRRYVQVMALSGLFAGLAGAIDVLGWQLRIFATDLQTGQLGFLGIAVALLGRNRAVGMLVASLLFAALLTGTSVRNLDPGVFPPELGPSLTFVIQGIVIVLISADLLLVYLWRRRRVVPA